MAARLSLSTWQPSGMRRTIGAACSAGEGPGHVDTEHAGREQAATGAVRSSPQQEDVEQCLLPGRSAAVLRKRSFHAQRTGGRLAPHPALQRGATRGWAGGSHMLDEGVRASGAQHSQHL